MNLVSLKARALKSGDALFVNDAGRFFAADDHFLERLIGDQLNATDHDFLVREGNEWEADDPLPPTAYRHAVAQRFAAARQLDYLVLVPTLRCNLSCSYCQVSRAAVHQTAYDWSEDTLTDVLRLIDGIEASAVKIEFQGGEPTLRPDLIRAVMDRARSGRQVEFVICTNLSELTTEILDIFDDPDVYISTSLDGPAETHTANRTQSAERTHEFECNLDFVLKRYGARKVSALPTINPDVPADQDALIDAYASRGLSSIFLRPINFQGFARKRHGRSREQDESWRRYYEAFIRKLIERNWADRSLCLDETYFTLCLNRIFRTGLDRHVDLRNPNPVGVDYVVIDYDGTVYPTDEARMLSRAGVIDLAIGDVRSGWASEKQALLNSHSTNEFDEDCSRCAYQPFCGRNIVDDLARYGRIDLPRTETAFCKRHLHLFDFIFELIYSDDQATLHSLSRWLRLPEADAQLGLRHA